MDFFKVLNLFNRFYGYQDYASEADLKNAEEVGFLHYCLCEDPTIQNLFRTEVFNKNQNLRVSISSTNEVDTFPKGFFVKVKEHYNSSSNVFDNLAPHIIYPKQVELLTVIDSRHEQQMTMTLPSTTNVTVEFLLNLIHTVYNITGLNDILFVDNDKKHLTLCIVD
jgi:hypothetical protein